MVSTMSDGWRFEQVGRGHRDRARDLLDSRRSRPLPSCSPSLGFPTAAPTRGSS